ncbi:hypothetical protein CUMW_026900 [Citrus unshiu]|nr:hypothetical protein CUMW_026900 [Citrus unshiu]
MRPKPPLQETHQYAVYTSYGIYKLGNAEEYVDGQFSGNLGEILIRCNNVLYLRGVPEDEEIEDADRD